MPISYQVNAEKAIVYIKGIPEKVMSVGMSAIVKFIVGDEQHGLKHDVAYKYVSRKEAYGSTGATFENGKPVPDGYFSAKQFRYVMAKLHSGEMKIGRKNDPTHYGQSWEWKQVQNDYYVTGNLPFDRFPANQNKLVGWRHYLKVVEANMKGAIKAVQKAVSDFLKQKGAK